MTQSYTPLPPRFLKSFRPAAPRMHRYLADIRRFTPEEYYDGSPRDWYSVLNRKIIGQEHAKKAASVILYDHFIRKVPSCALFVGPSGCGKTAIWEAVAAEFADGPDRSVTIADASQLVSVGYKGLQLPDVLQGVSQERGIVIMDEIDKAVMPNYGNSVNYSALLQGNLLKLLNHDKIVFPKTGDSSKPWVFDARNVTVILTGAFSGIYEKKQAAREIEARRIGFNGSPASGPPAEDNHITIDDLVAFGMMRELAGRIDLIVEMEAPSLDTYKEIVSYTVREMSKEYGQTITLSDGVVSRLAEETMESGTGARYVRAWVRQRLVDAIFDKPKADAYTLDA